jgi:hypothetical protein
MVAMEATAEAVIYEEAKRGIAAQSASLDELRSRTGLLLAAASVTASFLGAHVTDASGIGFLGILAIVAFGVAVVGCLYVLWPHKDAWTFVVSPTTLAEDWIDIEREGGTRAMQRFVAIKLEEHYDRNKLKLDELFAAFQIAAMATGAEVILWTAQLVT